jgi:hypothetical protein
MTILSQVLFKCMKKPCVGEPGSKQCRLPWFSVKKLRCDELFSRYVCTLCQPYDLLAANDRTQALKRPVQQWSPVAIGSPFQQALQRREALRHSCNNSKCEITRRKPFAELI